VTRSPGAAEARSRGQVAAVVETLGRRVAARHYREGEVLPVEQDLANSLGVGRNALREAVKVLSSKGLIVTGPRSGTRVRPRSEWNMLDPDVLSWHADPETATPEFLLSLLEARRIIEPKAAELAAVRGTREDMAAILSAYERMEQVQTDPEARMLADIDLHTAILRASHNDVLAHFRHAVGSYLRAHAKLGRSAGTADDDALRHDLELHRRIATAIVTGKAKSAYALTVEMLNQGRQRVTRARDDDQNL
jgi:GntR family transcriptional regulator, galactonate operon transcriptional repressor